MTPAPEDPCQTCNDVPEVCATVPGLRHCEKANREPEDRLAATLRRMRERHADNRIPCMPSDIPKFMTIAETGKAVIDAKRAGKSELTTELDALEAALKALQWRDV